jgi:hypothetical protein
MKSYGECKQCVFSGDQDVTKSYQSPKTKLFYRKIEINRLMKQKFYIEFEKVYFQG